MSLSRARTWPLSSPHPGTKGSKARASCLPLSHGTWHAATSAPCPATSPSPGGESHQGTVPDTHRAAASPIAPAQLGSCLPPGRQWGPRCPWGQLGARWPPGPAGALLVPQPGIVVLDTGGHQPWPHSQLATFKGCRRGAEHCVPPAATPRERGGQPSPAPRLIWGQGPRGRTELCLAAARHHSERTGGQGEPQGPRGSCLPLLWCQSVHGMATGPVPLAELSCLAQSPPPWHSWHGTASTAQLGALLALGEVFSPHHKRPPRRCRAAAPCPHLSVKDG